MLFPNVCLLMFWILVPPHPTRLPMVFYIFQKLSKKRPRTKAALTLKNIQTHLKQIPLLKVFLTPIKLEWLELSLNPPPKTDYKDGGFGEPIMMPLGRNS